ncbi:hypothetical protein KP509_09G014700 [Ceratopteris richardii]|nr:hypothetical protein KP509_09G014700 [Ceratopteris richardii]
MFTSCGSLVDAHQVFLSVPKPGTYSWNAIILAHAKLGDGYMAVLLYCKMHLGVVNPNKYLFCLILKVCSNTGEIDHGRLVHHQMISMKIISDVSLDTALISMYMKCGSLHDAQRVFFSLKDRKCKTWSALISGCSDYGCSSVALTLFEEMQEQSILSDRVAFLCTFRACNSLQHVMIMHNQVLKHNMENDPFIASRLIDMYSKCRNLEEAYNTFERVHGKDAAIWSSIISCCSHVQQDNRALELFQRMIREGTKPNDFIFSCVLTSCANSRTLTQGRIIHDMSLKSNLLLDVVVGNSLIDMYAKCGSLDEAFKVFEKLASKNCISWGTIIDAYVRNGSSVAALEIFDSFKASKQTSDRVIFISVLKACCNVGELVQGRQIHIEIINYGLSEDTSIGNMLIFMYLICQKLEDARNVFDKLSARSCITWSAMLSGYVQQQQWMIVLDLFEELLQKELKLDKVIFLYVLEACANLRSITKLCQIHDQVIKHSLETERALGSALLDTYCKCGHFYEGYWIFERLPCKDIVTWGAMIGGLVHGGEWSLARRCLSKMREQGMSPCIEIYSCILNACSSSGLVEEGQWYFDNMKEDHKILPNIEHFTCMVDLFGRTGLLNESEDFLQTMPVPPNETSWTSFLTSCKTYYNNLNIGCVCSIEHVRSPKEVEPRSKALNGKCYQEHS